MCNRIGIERLDCESVSHLLLYAIFYVFLNTTSGTTVLFPGSDEHLFIVIDMPLCTLR